MENFATELIVYFSKLNQYHEYILQIVDTEYFSN